MAGTIAELNTTARAQTPKLNQTLRASPHEVDSLTNHIDASQVLPALAKVDEVYQAAIALFYLDDLCYNEIANALEVPVGTVKSRLSRGIMQLRTILLGGEASAEVVTDRDLSATAPQGTSSKLVSPTCVPART